MTDRKKIFSVVFSLCLACMFSSCELHIPMNKKAVKDTADSIKNKIVSVFNKQEEEPVDEYSAVLLENPVSYKWETLEISGGGYVSGIVCNKKEKGLMYARTEKSGAFRYNTEFEKWESVTDFLTAEENCYMSVESIATDDNEPNRVYMACGSLESDKNGVIFRSEDYGQSWQRYELPFKCGGDADGRGCGERLAIDPNDSRIIYYGSRSDGLWKSQNYGETWSVVPSFNTMGNFAQNSADIGIMWIIFDKDTGGEGNPTLNIYAGVADVEGLTVYKSENTGITWDAIDTGLSGLYPVKAEMASDGRIYMVFNNNATPEPEPGSGAVYVYDTQKKEFKNITPAAVSTGGFGAVAVNEDDPNMIAVSTLGFHYPKENIYITYDGGKRWKSFYKGDDDYFEKASGNADIGSSITSLNFAAGGNGKLIFGNDSGIFEAVGTNILNEDGEITEKIKLKDISKGLSIMSIRDMSYSRGMFYAVSEKFGGFAIEDISETVSLDKCFDVRGSVDIDCAWRENEKAVMCGEQQILFTDCGGKKWYSTANLPEGYEKLSGGSVCISSDGNIFTWSPDDISARPMMTEDFGQTWERCDGLPSGASIYSDKNDGLKFYAVSENSFYVSDDGARNFRKTITNISANSSIAVSQQDGVVWICGKETYFSTDGGENFEQMKNLSAEHMVFGEAKILESGKAVYPIYIAGSIGGSPFGIYHSDDNGCTWEMISDTEKQFGMKPNAIVADSYENGKIYVATDGRAVLMGSPDEKGGETDNGTEED